MTPSRNGGETSGGGQHASDFVDGDPSPAITVPLPLKPSEVLAKAADLIEPEGAWTQRDAVLNATGSPCSYEDAECFCLFGAVRVAAGLGEFSDPTFDGAWWFLERSVAHGRGPIDWNDAPDRTQAEVVAALRKASELARAEGQ